MLTKHVERALIERHMAKLCLFFKEGRAASAPPLTGESLGFRRP